MDANQFVIETESGTGQIVRARVIAVHDDGTVAISGDGTRPVVCDVMSATDAGPPALSPKDLVVAWHSGRVEDRGVILGRIGVSQAARAETAPEQEHLDIEVPNELVLEAKHSLTLRVGSGSITIREDGKILIKGKDLVSHATRMNRIKGGSVQIN